METETLDRGDFEERVERFADPGGRSALYPATSGFRLSIW